MPLAEARDIDGSQVDFDKEISNLNAEIGRISIAFSRVDYEWFKQHLEKFSQDHISLLQYSTSFVDYIERHLTALRGIIEYYSALQKEQIWILSFWYQTINLHVINSDLSQIAKRRALSLINKSRTTIDESMELFKRRKLDCIGQTAKQLAILKRRGASLEQKAFKVTRELSTNATHNNIDENVYQEFLLLDEQIAAILKVFFWPCLSSRISKEVRNMCDWIESINTLNNIWDILSHLSHLWSLPIHSLFGLNTLFENVTTTLSRLKGLVDSMWQSGVKRLISKQYAQREYIISQLIELTTTLKLPNFNKDKSYRDLEWYIPFRKLQSTWTNSEVKARAAGQTLEALNAKKLQKIL